MTQKVSFHIDGMSCQACAARIEKVLSKKEAVSSAEVNYAGERASVSFDETQTNPKQIAEWIAAAGFQAALIENNMLPENRTATPFPYLSALSWLILIPFLVGMAGMAVGKHFLMMSAPIQFALATIVQFGAGAVFYRGAFVALKNKAPNMDVLVALGTTAVWAYSVLMMVKGDWRNVYFEASVMVIALVSLGKYLELRVKRNSLNSIALLTQLVPKEVEVFRHNEWRIMPLTDVRINDIVRAKQGEKIAADGVVVEGEAYCDESHLTGEPQAVHKKNQAKVFAGALVDNGSVSYRVEALGNATLLGDMIKALDDAQNSKAPVARLADIVAAWFVPIVIAVATLTFFINYSVSGSLNMALMRAAAVLVIACPCALGLATPAAIMAGMGVAAKYGILFKDAAALETAGKIDTVVFDKTGTLTVGKPQVVAFRQPEQGFIYSENDFIQVAASIEARVSHPLATAIVQYAKSKNLPFLTVNNVEVVSGLGVKASVVNFGEVKIGTPEFCGFRLPESTEPIWQASSIVGIAMNNETAIFAIADALREDSKQAISRLHDKNIHTALFSGDKESSVTAVANALNIQKKQGGMLPRNKADAIIQLKKQGHTVAMVGDGINDAAALTAADTGFALKSGTDIAQHTANATLMNGSANQVADAVMIARRTLNTIRQNLFFAFIYNIIGIPLAAVGILSPAIAGAAMAASSISVLGNAVRLKHFRVK
ncbi:MAG: heavy metal translocating P-type ATPase [Neisseriaceae bacterium]|nr:heavy metal translocating P-type ATPase [Neisseriaceae bacterium]